MFSIPLPPFLIRQAIIFRCDSLFAGMKYLLATICLFSHPVHFPPIFALGTFRIYHIFLLLLSRAAEAIIASVGFFKFIYTLRYDVKCRNNYKLAYFIPALYVVISISKVI